MFVLSINLSRGSPVGRIPVVQLSDLSPRHPKARQLGYPACCTPFSFPGNQLKEPLPQMRELLLTRWCGVLLPPQQRHYMCRLRLYFARCFKRPPDNLYMRLKNEQYKSKPFTPAMSTDVMKILDFHNIISVNFSYERANCVLRRPIHLRSSSVAEGGLPLPVTGRAGHIPLDLFVFDRAALIIELPALCQRQLDLTDTSLEIYL